MSPSYKAAACHRTPSGGYFTIALSPAERNHSLMNRLLLLSCFSLALSLHADPIRVVVWDEQQPAQQKVYTNFIGGQISSYLKTLPNLAVTSTGFNAPDQGLSDD